MLPWPALTAGQHLSALGWRATGARARARLIEFMERRGVQGPAPAGSDRLRRVEYEQEESRVRKRGE